jgi:hypothetical protein
VLVCIGVVGVDALQTGVVDQAAPGGVQEDAEEVVVVLDDAFCGRPLRLLTNEPLDPFEVTPPPVVAEFRTCLLCQSDLQVGVL